MIDQKVSSPEAARPDVELGCLDRWEQTARQCGFTDYLSPEDGFRTHLGTRRRWASGAKPGIYFWIAQNGEAYVGQSVQPLARLRQHMKAHGDLVRAAFRPCDNGELDGLEAQLVREVGEHFALRNIKLAVSTASTVPFDALVPPEEQNAFLAGEALVDQPWQAFDHLTQLQARKFDEFMRHPQAEAALAALAIFVSRAIPKPAATEVGFWSVSIRPRECFIRVNAGRQEVFTFELWDGEAIVRVLTDEPVEPESQRTRYKTVSYVTALAAWGLDQWLTGRPLISARRLSGQLMRHTQALNSGSHCPQAVRTAFLRQDCA